MARPSKYTPERVERLLQAIRIGAPIKMACSYAGIDHGTFLNWRERYSEFSAAIKEAEGIAVVGWLAKIEKAASDGNWQAAAWKLERRYPEDFGRRDRVELDVRHIAERVAADQGLDVDELLAEAERLIKVSRD